MNQVGITTSLALKKLSLRVVARLTETATLFLCCFVIVNAAPAETNNSSNGNTGAVFVMTNRAFFNEVIAFHRAADGTLSQPRHYLTGGNGQGVDFDTQGGLTLSRDNRFLYACNPGSDDVTIFEVRGDRLRFLQKVDAGDQPTSITLIALWPATASQASGSETTANCILFPARFAC